MTEKERSANGLLYNANYDKELLDERAACKIICYEYNQTSPAMSQQRIEILKRLLGKTGKSFIIEPPFFVIMVIT